MSDRLNFDQAAQHLGVSAEELQGLVSNQEIRAEHDGGEVYFSQQDLDAYKEGRSTEPTVVLSEDGGGMLEDEGLELEDFSTDETVRNIEGLLEDDGGSLLEGESELDLGGVGDETVIDTDDLSLDSFDFEEAAGGVAVERRSRLDPQKKRPQPVAADVLSAPPGASVIGSRPRSRRARTSRPRRSGSQPCAVRGSEAALSGEPRGDRSRCFERRAHPRCRG